MGISSISKQHHDCSTSHNNIIFFQADPSSIYTAPFLNFENSPLRPQNIDLPTFLNHTSSSSTILPAVEIHNVTLQSSSSGWSDDEKSLLMDENDMIRTKITPSRSYL